MPVSSSATGGHDELPGRFGGLSSRTAVLIGLAIGFGLLHHACCARNTRYLLRCFTSGRLILCSVCGHDRFHQQRTLMNTRGAAFFNMTWASQGADTRICQRCTHVMWFARE